MNWQRAFREGGKSLIASLVVFLFLEIVLRVVYYVRNAAVEYLPLPYAIGDEYGPMPPWLDQFRILEPDDELIWKNRSNVRRTYVDVFTPVQREEDRVSLLRQFVPKLPASLQMNPTWEIAINSDGFRDRDFPSEKSASVLRIVCLGDSWTFGANVGQDETYPHQLQEMLEREFPDARFEVLNMGVLGYSSFQGLQLLKTKAIALKPDFVIIGFAMNDASIAGYRDKDMPAHGRKHAISDWIKRLPEHIECYKLLRYVAALLTYKPRSMAERIQATAEHTAETEKEWWNEATVDSAGEGLYEGWMRVSPKDFDRNIREMIGFAWKHNVGVILLHNQLWGTRYRFLLRKIANETGVPFIDSQSLLDSAKTAMETHRGQKLGLGPKSVVTPDAGDHIEVIFRVYLGDRPVPKAVFITGNHPQLGNLIPNKIAMYDDGTHGDQRAGDNVWSYSARLAEGTGVFYVYTNSGEEGKWEGLDIPDVRRFWMDRRETESVLYRPIERFGELTLRADSWHTNAQGYKLIAGAILDVLKMDITRVRDKSASRQF